MVHEQAATTTKLNYTQVLDTNLYASLETLDGIPYPLQFHRVGGLVVLREGPYTSTILERRSFSRNASWFSFQISHLHNGIEDAGWLLRSKASFFLAYCLLGEGESIRALLIPRERLTQELENRGFPRAILAGRAGLIRRGGRGGIFQSADPDISFSFYAEGERRPVEVRVKAPVLEKLAAGDFVVSMGDDPAPLKGMWLGNPL